MSINWFPGHMNKARLELKKAVRKIDVLIEVLDARLPISSGNPFIRRLAESKPCIKIFNKSDLADPVVTKLWMDHFKETEGIIPMSMSATKKSEASKIPALCRKLAPKTEFKYPHAMIVGIPNIGKSTLINTLMGRKVAVVGDKPAVTRHQQKVQIKAGKESIFLSDTPGILWPEMGQANAAYRLAASGAVSDAAIDHVDVSVFAGDHLIKFYGDLIMARYKLKSLPESGITLLEEIGKRRGCLKKGGIIDMYKAADIFLNEIKAGMIGPISFERPEDFNFEEDEEENDSPEDSGENA